MTLTEHRDYYRPFSYPWAFEYYHQQQQMHWLPNEIPLAEDISDWKFKLTKGEKNLVTQILRFFTQGDIDIARGYIERYMQYFKAPEVRMMLCSFANTEAIHTHAYSHLLDTLGLPEAEYQAFHEYKEMENKHEYLFKKHVEQEIEVASQGGTGPFTKIPIYDSLKNIVLDLCKFSAFGEGLQLFSSFVILMNFQRFGKLKGLGQIITWSVRDESLHCEAMIKLFNTLIDENKFIWKSDFKQLIYQTCRDMVDLEDKFIDLAFEMGDIDGLTKDDVKQYVRYLADRRLLQLKLKPNFKVKKNPLSWFDDMLLGNEHGNFFETKVTEYSKGINRGDWADAF